MDMTRLLLFFCALASAAHAAGYIDGAAVFSNLSAPAINGNDRANGAAIEAGWKFGAAGRHAVTFGLQAVQNSGAHEFFASVSGTQVTTRSLRTRLEAAVVGYAWETSLAPSWSFRAGAGIGLARIREETESTVHVGGTSSTTITRNSGAESAKICGRVGADIRWHFSTHGHLLLGVEWLRKEADDDPTLPFTQFGAVTATSGRIGIGIRF
jgi:hypothetical protein